MSGYTGLSPQSPTKYVGPNVALNTVVSRNRAPTGADYRMPETGKLYPFNTFWLVAINPTTGIQGDLWYLSKIVANVAYWVQLNSGGPLDYFSLTPYIVGPDSHSEFATIGAAITQAVSDGASSSNPKNIHIKPQNNGYTEDIILPDGINLVGFNASTLVIGNISMISGGVASLSGLSLQTNGNYIISVSGSAASILNIDACHFNCSNHTGIEFTNSSDLSTINIDTCDCSIGTTGIALYSMTSPGTIFVMNSEFFNNGLSSMASTNSLGLVYFQSCLITIPFSTSGGGIVNFYNDIVNTSEINTSALVTAGNGANNNFENCQVTSGSASCVSIGAGTTVSVVYCSLNSSNTNVLTGAGILQYAFLAFTGTSSGHNVTTETALPTL